MLLRNVILFIYYIIRQPSSAADKPVAMSQIESAHVLNSYTWPRHGNNEMWQRWLTFGRIEPEHSRVSRYSAAIRPSPLASVGFKNKLKNVLKKNKKLPREAPCPCEAPPRCGGCGGNLYGPEPELLELLKGKRGSCFLVRCHFLSEL